MSGVNKVILVGRLGKDPEVKKLNNDKSVANFSLATSESYRDKTTGEKVENTEWHNITIYGPLADVAGKYLKKGSLVNVNGKLRTRSYEVADGGKRYVTEIIADELTMLEARREAVEAAA